MDDTVEERLAAVERALTDGDHDFETLAETAAVTDRVDRLDAEMAELEDRVQELEAATQALRGYVGNVRAVNEEVRQRADLALEAVEATDVEPSERTETTSAIAGPTSTDSMEDEATTASSGPEETGPTDEPTLELTTGPSRTDEGVKDSGASDPSDTGFQRSDEDSSVCETDATQCPLCDGPGTGSELHRQRTCSASCRHQAHGGRSEPDGTRGTDRRGRTDGGTDTVDQTSPYDDVQIGTTDSSVGDAGVLQRIRALL